MFLLETNSCLRESSHQKIKSLSLFTQPYCFCGKQKDIFKSSHSSFSKRNLYSDPCDLLRDLKYKRQVHIFTYKNPNTLCEKNINIKCAIIKTTHFLNVSSVHSTQQHT